MVATHELVVTGGTVMKRFTSWARGEHAREWVVLSLLNRHVSGLVPVPVSADLSARPPTVVMSKVQGAPLSGTVTPAQFDALEVALRQLWSVPVGDLPPRRYLAEEVVGVVERDFQRWPRVAGVVGEAVASAAAFLTSQRAVDSRGTVVGHSDPNLANYLWDGSQIRIVDFEDAGRSDIAYELASLVEHLSARDTEWEDFVARFGVEPAEVLAGRRLTAVLWLHTLLRTGRSGGAGLSATVQRQAERVLSLM